MRATARPLTLWRGRLASSSYSSDRMPILNSVKSKHPGISGDCVRITAPPIAVFTRGLIRCINGPRPRIDDLEVETIVFHQDRDGGQAVIELCFLFREMRIFKSVAVGLLQASLTSAQTKYADNQVPVSKDSELVSTLFPDVEGVELLSPAFANGDTVPDGWTNGTSGPTTQDTLGR